MYLGFRQGTQRFCCFLDLCITHLCQRHAAQSQQPGAEGMSGAEGGKAGSCDLWVIRIIYK